MYTPIIITAILVSLDALFVGMSLKLQKDFKKSYIFVITGMEQCLMMEIEGSDDGHIHNETRKPRLVGGSVRYVYIAIGILSLALGCVGTVLPLIPTTPLVLMSAVCFSKSSQRLNNWLLSTKLYRKIVNGFVKRREISIRAKFTLLLAITVFMGLSFVLMSVASAPPAARVILAIVWLCHVLYFGFKVKTV